MLPPWSAVSPVTGKLDAWAWQTPPERLTQAWDPASEPPIPPGVALEAPAELTIAIAAPEHAAPERPAPAPLAAMAAPDDPRPPKA